jgi:hypothetical protein
MSETQRPSTPERGSAEWLSRHVDRAYAIWSDLWWIHTSHRDLTVTEMARVRALAAELRRIAEEMEGE